MRIFGSTSRFSARRSWRLQLSARCKIGCSMAAGAVVVPSARTTAYLCIAAPAHLAIRIACNFGHIILTYRVPVEDFVLVLWRKMSAVQTRSELVLHPFAVLIATLVAEFGSHVRGPKRSSMSLKVGPSETWCRPSRRGWIRFAEAHVSFHGRHVRSTLQSTASEC
jgi:hypothetical protein